MTVAERAALGERFWSKVRKTETCWLWTACIVRDGYGQFGVNGRMLRAHRAAFLDAGGVIPEGYTLDHLCRVRHCVNPAHLEAVTNAENVRRGKLLITHCPQGHAYSGQNLYLSQRGDRQCRACNRDRYRRSPQSNRRRVVEYRGVGEWREARLSCGHVLGIKALSKYDNARTLTCLACGRDKERHDG